MPPVLKFLEEWQRAGGSKGLDHLHRINRENVVAHGNVCQRPGATQRRLFWGMDTTEKHNGNHVWTEPQLKLISSADLTSQFVNDGYKCKGQHGKIMRFARAKTIIRAGKNTESEAVTHIIRMIRFLNGRYPTGIMSPNSVFSGVFKGHLTDNIKQYSLATYSTKFPGIAINLNVANSRCTPTVYTGFSRKTGIQKPSTFIAPGIRSVPEAIECMRRINRVASRYTTRSAGAGKSLSPGRRARRGTTPVGSRRS